MKKNSKMSASKVNLETRIGARISNSLYIAIRLIARSQSMTIEEKVAELCKKEVAYVSGQKWFIEMIQNGGADDIQPLIDIMEKRKKVDAVDDLDQQLTLINDQIEKNKKGS